MQVLLVERDRKDLINRLSSTVSPRVKLLYLFYFYDILLKSKSSNLIESYLPEHIENYITFLYKFEPAGVSPQLVENILKQIEQISQQSCIKQFYDRLNSAAQHLRIKYIPVKNALNGSNKELTGESNLYFPLLELGELHGEETTGLLETITVQIKEAKDNTKFLITPAGREIEKAIGEQIKISWNYALNYIKRFVRKANPAHKVFIQFDHRYGEYVGNSLGTALTLAFIRELLAFYNSPVLMKYSGKIVVTGGLDDDGKILCVSKEVIKQKTETVFYSTADVLVVTEEEKQFSREKLSELQKEYPNRNLKIIGVEDFEDLLNRRNIIKLKRQKIIVRSAKFVRHNWAAVFLLAAVIFLVYVGKFYDFDKNPAILVNKGFWLSVQNKNGKELWKKRMAFNPQKISESGLPAITEKIVDIDNDGTNEIILTKEDRNQFNPPKLQGRIACYSSKGEKIWEYTFHDTIKSIEMVHSLDYASFIIDTLTINNVKTIACFSDNVLYPSAVYFLNLKNGKRTGPTMWHVGHLHSGIFQDLNKDGNRELIMTGINNSMGRVIIFSIDVDKIGGQLPAAGDRMFENLPAAEVNNYVLLPKSDYTEYFDEKFNFVNWGSMNRSTWKENPFIYLEEGKPWDLKGITIAFNNDLTVKMIDISEGFQVARDELVKSGALQPPLSHTREYLDILFKQVRYWDGEKFIPLKKYEKIKAAP